MADSPYEKRLASRTKGSHGVVSEKKVAKSLGGRLTPASGSMHGAKGDVRVADFLLEAKSTSDQTMRVELHWLQKISHEALSIGKTPALSIRFVNPDGTPKKGGSFVAIPEFLFAALINNGSFSND